MFKLLFVLPAAALVLAFVLGRRPSTRWGLLTLAAGWFAAATILANWSFGDSLVTVFAGFAIGLFSPIAAALVAIRLGRDLTPAPVDIAFEIYKDLDPETKRRLREAARTATKTGLKGAGKYFRDNGSDNMASACRTASKLL